MTVDGVGEWCTGTLGRAKGNKITLDRELVFPHSVDLLYSAFTAYCGFEVNEGEYELIDLPP
jgi:carbamoyltransferase